MEKLEPSINKQLVGMVQVESTMIVLCKYLRSMFSVDFSKYKLKLSHCKV